MSADAGFTERLAAVIEREYAAANAFPEFGPTYPAPTALAAALASLVAEEVAAAEVRALREFAADPCGRNARIGLTREARHFGKTYARLALDRADRIATTDGGGDRG